MSISMPGFSQQNRDNSALPLPAVAMPAQPDPGSFEDGQPDQGVEGDEYRPQERDRCRVMIQQRNRSEEEDHRDSDREDE
jgi:hypothetical protein